ncbi:hypothetical protein [Glycomyces sp. NPDC021274]|uniref:hypothetical protein n=1 Tax=Glycomyces sp. NPDC021274 TaxID=3155120 RepID=UPI0033EFAE7A
MAEVVTAEHSDSGLKNSMPRTHSLNVCIRTAEKYARSHSQDLAVSDLMWSTLFTEDEQSRSRLSLKLLGRHHFLSDEGYAEFLEVKALPYNTLGSEETPGSELEVLSRLQYWVERTGDSAADTVHLLLACIELGSQDREGRSMVWELAVNPREVIRAAMSVRNQTSFEDRQSRARRPILSPLRQDRPQSYRFETERKQTVGMAAARPTLGRSQMPGPTHSNSRVYAYILQIYLGVLTSRAISLIVLLGLIAFGSFTISPWCLIWVMSATMDRTGSPLWFRLLVDSTSLAASVALGLPWWLPATAATHRALDATESAMAAVAARSDCADPDVTGKTLRSDARMARRAAGWYKALKMQGKLS